MSARATTPTLLVLLVLAPHATAAARPSNADDLVIVDCLLPGQLRQLGGRTTYLSARRPVKTTAFDCRVRNGEYVLEDRASLSTALKIWLETAESGDPEAQTTVGEIFERGFGVAPDYGAAASWYRRAAEAGYSRAQINLGNLYEKGLGVPRDGQAALSWYRRAAGLQAAVVLDPTPDVTAATVADDDERARLRADVERLEAETRTLRAELEAARSVAQEPSPAPPDPGPSLASTVAAYALEIDALRATVAARERDIAALQAALLGTRAQLQAESDALAQARRAREAEAGSAAVAGAAALRAQAEAERRAAELSSALQALAERETALAAQAQEVAQLQQRLAALAARPVATAEAPGDDVAAGIVAGPEIALIDPVLPRTRGLVKITVPAQLDRRRIVGRVTAPAGLVSLAVNDVPAEPNPAGVFVAEIAVPAGESRVDVIAIDRQGKRTDVSFVVAHDGRAASDAAIVTATAGLPPVDFGRYHALLIGNESYRQLPRLSTPGADVTELDRLLRERFGFETTVVRDATRYEILSALNDLRAKLTTADNLLVYYAGHGELDQVNMRGHWLPVDAEPVSTANWISNVTITDMLNVIRAKQILLVVDSCYSGTLTRSSIATLTTGQTDAERLTWLKLMADKRARVVLTSGALAPVLDAGGGRHSVFAKALLDTLGSLSEITEGQVLYRDVAARVAHAAATYRFEQTPQFAPIAHAGHESGDFFLLPQP
jgi:hypothetical protein